MRARGKNSKTPKTSAQIKRLLKDVLGQPIASDAKQISEEQLRALGATVAEFLDCFLILGFTTEGDAVQIVMNHNPKEASALSNLIANFASTRLNPPQE